jgi:hypothetical protein
MAIGTSFNISRLELPPPQFRIEPIKQKASNLIQSGGGGLFKDPPL